MPIYATPCNSSSTSRIERCLAHHGGKRLAIGVRCPMVGLRPRLLLRLPGHERVEDIGADVAARLGGIPLQLTVGREDRIAIEIADDEGVIGVLRGKLHAHVRLPGTPGVAGVPDAAGCGSRAAGKLPVVIDTALHHSRLRMSTYFLGILVAALVVHVTGPEPHLHVFLLLPAGHQVDPETTLGYDQSSRRGR